MAEKWNNEATFRTMADEEIHVFITPDWDVFINNEAEPRSNLSGHAAVILGGFVASLDVVIPSADIYTRSDDAYRFAVEKKFANELDGVPDRVSAKDFGKHVQRIIKPVSTPFKTNILTLKASTLKLVLLACSNTYDDDFVRSVIKGTILSADESANAYFIRNLLTDYERKKDTGTSIAFAKKVLAAAKLNTDIPVQDSNTPLTNEPEKDEIVMIVQYSDAQEVPSVDENQDLSEDNDQDTDEPIIVEETQCIDSSQIDTDEDPETDPEGTITITGKTDGQKVVPTPEIPIFPEFITRSDVVKSVGELILDAKPGAKFTEEKLLQKLNIRTSDYDNIRIALYALINAGYLRASVQDVGTYYVRLKKPNPKKID